MTSTKLSDSNGQPMPPAIASVVLRNKISEVSIADWRPLVTVLPTRGVAVPHWLLLSRLPTLTTGTAASPRRSRTPHLGEQNQVSRDNDFDRFLNSL